jgi:predicted transposase/invertase (TIGR01784 family)
VSRIVENDIREQAVAEGRLKGRLEIARKLKENGFSIADIVRIAGLSPEEIDKL